MRNRKDLPLVAKTQIRFHLNELVEELRKLNWLDVQQYNDFDYSAETPLKKLLEKNLEVRKLAMSATEIENCKVPEDHVSRGYRQLSLTEPFLKKEDSIQNREMNLGLSAKQRLRRLQRDSKHYDPDADERNYGKLREAVGPKLRELLAQFQGDLCRVRLAALMPGAQIQPHRDYDPSYLVRFHIPLITNSASQMCFSFQGETMKYCLQADGGVYFLNTGFIHWVENHGVEPRIHLLVDIQGQDSLANLQEMASEIF
jgi:hypothetical protein